MLMSSFQRATLASLERWRIPFDSIDVDRGCPLGQGGFGDVYLGTMYGECVAVKVIRTTGDHKQQAQVAFVSRSPEVSRDEPQLIEQRVARELKVWATLQHPNILPLSGFCLSDDFTRAWLISPYESRGNICTYVEKEKPDLKRRIELVSQKGVLPTER